MKYIKFIFLMLVINQTCVFGKALPDFLIIGAMKAGTTSLYSYLTRHPQINAASKKRNTFF